MSSYYKKSRLKYVFLAFTCATAFALSGIASACGNNKSPEEEADKPAKKEDTQLLKNGNFEFFNIPEKKDGGNEPVYLIKPVENWSHGGTSSYTMSGIISTSDKSWAEMTREDLAEDLDYNNSLDSSSANYLSQYIDYNGMKSSDLLYKDQYAALDDEETTDDDENEGDVEEPTVDPKEMIENPGTHYNVTGNSENGYVTADGDTVYVKDGEYFLAYDEENDEYSEPISNVLMLHNYATSHNGIAQNYSSIELELPANTAAEVSVWVKTSYLKFDQGKDVNQDRGANITVTHTVGSSTLDKFMISCINTEKLLKEGKIDEKYNGWAQYTIYVNACDFASTKIKLELGLGETGYTTEGYAFFDDVSVTKYVSLDKSESFAEAENANLLKDTTCNLLTDASLKIYKADSYVRNPNSETNKVEDERFSRNFHYFIDLASGKLVGVDKYKAYEPINFKEANLEVGYTVDDDNYVSSKYDFDANKQLKGFTSTTDVKDKHLPFSSSLKDKGLKNTYDYLAFFEAGYEFKSSDTEYYSRLNKALNGEGDNPKGVADLPKNSENIDNTLVMLSSFGAAYTTSFDLSVPRNGNETEGYQIVSFWVKTSDMDGKTAATVSIIQKGKDENKASFTIDTSDMVTNIGDEDDEKDIFGGWVQCFFFVKNELEVEGTNDKDEYTVKISFGNTTIKGTDVNSYKAGWVAVANMQYLNVTEDVFAYTSSGSHTASLTISEEAEKHNQVFDSVYANESHEIEKDLVNASSYTGVNGGSSSVKKNGHVSIPFDSVNNNVDVYGDGSKFTGLLNKDHFVDGKYDGKSWYNDLVEQFLDNIDASNMTATAKWNKIFGEKSYQPLIITNKLRTSYVARKDADETTFKNYYVRNDDGSFEEVDANAEFDEKETYYSLENVRNYGYFSEKLTVSSDSYKAITVRVKVSKNAIAYIYLVDPSATENVLSFTAPHYSFYYNDEGDVLKEEPKDNATTSEQRKNVLYTLREDGLYEDADGKLRANIWNYKKLYYELDSSGNKVYIENVKDGEIHTDENGKEANHYLVTGDGTKIYEVKDGKYYYIVEGKTQSDEILPFDKNYARYDLSGVKEEYMVEIDGNKHSDWVTVTFVIHTGNAELPYRLELWSGKRDEYITEGNDEDGGVVIFDYNYKTVSNDDEKDEREDEIIQAYRKAFIDAGKGELLSADTTGKNILYYANLAKENGINVSAIADKYNAHYYTYSLYDSADFTPFNRTIATDGATGYDYSASAQSESLIYLQVADENEYTVFADYSSINKSVSFNNPSDDSGSGNTSNSDGDSNKGEIWLLASSIILVIALVFAIIAIFLKDFIKKARHNKVTSKNNYDQRKINRYKRKLHLPQESVEADEGDAEEVPVENEVEESVDETPEVTEDMVEELHEAPVNEEVAETPAEESSAEEEAPVEEAPSDNSDKQE